MEINKNKRQALKGYFQSLKKLRDEGILINSKDFTCQIGEWLVEEIYGGKRAKTNQQDWDVDVNGKRIQVKAHAKADSNPARFSGVKKSPIGAVDELIIIVFSENYKLKEFYKIPWEDAIKCIKERTNDKKPELNWSAVSNFKEEISCLPRQDLIELFK